MASRPNLKLFTSRLDALEAGSIGRQIVKFQAFRMLPGETTAQCLARYGHVEAPAAETTVFIRTFYEAKPRLKL